MRDIPFFTTEYGVAGLCLKEIPYTACAYITILDSSDVQELLNEAVSFCRAAGAEQIYACGHSHLEKYPLHTIIVRMSCNKKKIPQFNATAVAVNQESMEQWREIYNAKMHSVETAAYMSVTDCEKAVKEGKLFFVMEEGCLIGIGSVDETGIQAIASVVSGKGRVVLSSLCEKISSEIIHLDVSSQNYKAMRLYTRMGFEESEERSRWYHIQ